MAARRLRIPKVPASVVLLILVSLAVLTPGVGAPAVGAVEVRRTAEPDSRLAVPGRSAVPDPPTPVDELPGGGRSEHCPAPELDSELHPPILVDEDADFGSPLSGVRSGSGTPEDPYVISEWYIAGQGDQLGELLFGPEPVYSPVSISGIAIQGTTKHVVIEDNVIAGTGYPQGLDFGVVVAAANVTVRGNVVCSTTLDGIQAFEATSAVVRQNRVLDARVAIRSVGSPGVELLDNVAEASVYGISVEESPGAVVRGNKVSRSFQIGILSHAAEECVIDGNTVTGRLESDTGIYVFASDRFSVASNSVSGAGGEGLVVGASRGGLAEANVVLQNGGAGLFLWDDELEGGNVLRRNRSEGNGGRAGFGFADGVVVADSHGNLLEGNVAERNIGNGFYLFGGDNNRLEGNVAVENSRFGYSFWDDVGTLVRGNRSEENGSLLGWTGGDAYDGGGIRLYESRPVVEGNAIVNNAGTGMLFAGAPGATATGNRVESNERGIVLWYASGQILRDNVLAGNEAGFGIDARGLQHFDNDVDASNTVDGRPVVVLQQATGELDWRTLDPGYLALVGAYDLTVTDVNARNSVQGILVFGGVGVRITGGTFAGNDIGVDIMRARDVTVSSSSFSDNGTAIQLAADTALTAIDGNHIRGGDAAIALESMAVPPLGVVFPEETTISDNTIDGAAELVIDAASDVEARITGNTIIGPSELAVSIPKGARVEGNVFRGIEGNAILVSMITTTGKPDGPARIVGNAIEGPLGTAIDVWMGGDARIEGNTLSGPGETGVLIRSFYAAGDALGNGISGFDTAIEATSDGWLRIVQGNELVGNGTALRTTGGAAPLSVVGNAVAGNEAGIRLVSRSANTTVECNRVTGNETVGVALIGGARLVWGTELEGNLIDGNGTGVEARTAPIHAADNRVTGNRTGILVGDLPTGSTLRGNHIVGNVEWGVASDDAPATDAEGNWWGDASGPTAALNPGGRGDRSADDIGYRPWLTTAPASAGACAPPA